jgi:hypothetical protein
MISRCVTRTLLQSRGVAGELLDNVVEEELYDGRL